MEVTNGLVHWRIQRGGGALGAKKHPQEYGGGIQYKYAPRTVSALNAINSVWTETKNVV